MRSNYLTRTSDVPMTTALLVMARRRLIRQYDRYALGYPSNFHVWSTDGLQIFKPSANRIRGLLHTGMCGRGVLGHPPAGVELLITAWGLECLPADADTTADAFYELWCLS